MPKEFRKWMYPPDYPVTPGQIVVTQNRAGQLSAEGWHEDTKFLSQKTGLKAEIKKLRAILADREDRLKVLYGDDPSEEAEPVERTCNICGVTFHAMDGYAAHMETHRPKEEGEG
jgi:hypothetical protein